MRRTGEGAAYQPFKFANVSQKRGKNETKCVWSGCTNWLATKQPASGRRQGSTDERDVVDDGPAGAVGHGVVPGAVQHHPSRELELAARSPARAP